VHVSSGTFSIQCRRFLFANTVHRVHNFSACALLILFLFYRIIFLVARFYSPWGFAGWLQGFRKFQIYPNKIHLPLTRFFYPQILCYIFHLSVTIMRAACFGGLFHITMARRTEFWSFGNKSSDTVWHFLCFCFCILGQWKGMGDHKMRIHVCRTCFQRQVASSGGLGHFQSGN
jgi:hypothetical protein